MQVHSEFWNEDFYHNFSSLPASVRSFIKLFKHYHSRMEKRISDTHIQVATPLDSLFWEKMLAFQPELQLPGITLKNIVDPEVKLLHLVYQAEKDTLLFPEWGKSWLLPCDALDIMVQDKKVYELHSPLQQNQLMRLFTQGSLALESAMKQSLFEGSNRSDRQLERFLDVPGRADFKDRKILIHFEEADGEFILDTFVAGDQTGGQVKVALDFARFRQILILGESLILDFGPDLMDVISPDEEFYDHLKTVVNKSFECFYELLNEVEGNRIRTHDREALFERFFPSIQDYVEIEQKGEFLHFHTNTLTEQKITVHDWDDQGQAPIDWLEVRFVFRMGDYSLDLDEIRMMMSRGYIIKSGQMLTFNSEDKERFSELIQSLDLKREDGTWQIRRFRIPQLLNEEVSLELPPSLKDLPRELDKEKALVKVPIHTDLKSILRGYQKTGVYWLSFLHRFHFGGILADEMGLGKTLQVLTFLESIRGEGISLIVCPSSLVYNWAQEIDKFMQGRLKYTLIYGNREKRLQQLSELKEYDVAITSYHLAHLDKELYQDISFKYCILDEAQHIKNKSAKRTISIKDITSQHRIAITGTPIENNVGELWSIFDFLMPGFLGSHTSFKDEFENPISGFDRKTSKASFARLKRLLHPFILRRTKEMVYKELPPKIEQVLTLELSEDQKTLYLDTLARVRNHYLPILESRGPEGSYLEFLAALTRLRQICLHPGLVYPEYAQPDTEADISVKLSALIELVEEVMDSGQRVLVFSQFVSMLKLIRREFHKNEIEYLYLDGKTRDRVGLVEHFNQSDIPVFLISLKAGGTGLNLTGANAVILFDPWWNPAVENQAIDRAHRIGQNKTVNVYRLMTRGTIEEKIYQLQARKKVVFDEVLSSNETFIKRMKREDIMEIFQSLSDIDSI